MIPVGGYIRLTRFEVDTTIRIENTSRESYCTKEQVRWDVNTRRLNSLYHRTHEQLRKVIRQ